MIKAVPNALVENCLRSILKEEGFSLTPRRRQGETGVDVIASKDGVSHYIEVIGYKKKGWIRAKDFYEGLFRTVSRLYVGRYPELVAVGLYFDVAVLPGSVEVHSGPLKLPLDP